MLIESKGAKHYSEMRKSCVQSDYFAARSIMKVTEQIADEMPQLDLPRMTPEARNAFQAVLAHELLAGNGSVRDLLEFAKARGICAHPCDWVPSSESDNQFPDL